jgi:mono/diheme cytochrome c family protein
MTPQGASRIAVAVVITAVVVASEPALGQQPARPPARPPAADPHAGHGTPIGWKFTLPKGNPANGRDVFVKFECYTRHQVKGEKLPAPTEQTRVGPELSQMAPLHDEEYFAEAVINPSAVIDKDKGYQAPDGSSKMPEFNDAITVKELIDLVAYLRSLKPASGTGSHPGH